MSCCDDSPFFRRPPPASTEGRSSLVRESPFRAERRRVTPVEELRRLPDPWGGVFHAWARGHEALHPNDADAVEIVEDRFVAGLADWRVRRRWRRCDHALSMRRRGRATSLQACDGSRRRPTRSQHRETRAAWPVPWRWLLLLGSLPVADAYDSWTNRDISPAAGLWVARRIADQSRAESLGVDLQRLD